MNCYKLLTECTELINLLCNGEKSIFKDQSPDSSDFPVCVVTETGETPTLFAENWPKQVIKSVSIYVLTKDGDDTKFNQIIINLMLENGARYVRMNRDIDYEYFWVRYDFIYNENVDYRKR